jgi:hypothetical protein
VAGKKKYNSLPLIEASELTMTLVEEKQYLHQGAAEESSRGDTP